MKGKQVLETHKQFRQSSSSSVKKIIHSNGAPNSELSQIIDGFTAKCDVCDWER